MSQASSPTLEDLRNVAEPAWLWDWQMARVVWANAAGLAFFGCETLFDLIDRPFDPAEPGVEAIGEAGARLRRGQAQPAQLLFPSAGKASPLAVTCHVHTLPDGRPGLLVAARGAGAGDGQVAATALAAAFDVLPNAAIVIARDGRVLHANAAAVKLLGAHAASLAGELLARAELAGTASVIRPVATLTGKRDLRITVKLLPQPGEAFAVVLADDVTARRALEKQMMPAAATPVAEQKLSREEAETFVTLGKVLRGEVSPRPRRAIDFPPPVRKMLDGMAGANLLVQNGVLEYGNPAAAALLGFADPEELMAQRELAAAIAALPANARAASLPGADGTMADFALAHASLPWRNGPAQILTLAPAPDATAEAAPVATPEPAAPELPFPELPAETPSAPPALAVEATPVEPATPVQPPVAAATVEPPPAEVPVAPAADAVVADAELQAILDTASDGIITLDSDGRIKTFSAGAEAIFGYRSAEVRKRPLADLLVPESRRTLREYLAALQGPGLASVFNDGREVTAIVKQGGEVPLFLTISKLQTGKPGQAALCAVLRDITQWKKTEAELREARDEAERASRLKSEFLANVSHELRTPLNAIIGFSDMMRLESFGEIENEKYRSYVNDIHASGSHLLSLINDLLDLSKVEAGKLELNFTAVNLGEVIDHAFKLIQDTATQSRVILRKNVPADLPNVVADLRSMRQIVLNILSNAVKFTDPGGQVIASATLTPQGELKVKIKDTGVGMKESELKQALEPFRRVAIEGREVQGTGLGLPLTKALAEANRTHFDIASEPGKGTTVEITFPTTRVLAM